MKTAADITLVNLNMLYVRHADGRAERERHLPLGPLYLTAALERAGLRVDFRDYQTFACDDPFSPAAIEACLAGSAPVLGVSCMANLLPFALLALRDFKRAHPGKTVVLGGVGAKSVERLILERCPWIDVVARGEGEVSGPLLAAALRDQTPLEAVPGVSFMKGRTYVETPRPERISLLDELPPPAFGRVRVADYGAYGMITSRGCPYPCTFCSVAPVWDLKSFSRSPANIVGEMGRLHAEHGVRLFLFQDEFFVSGKARVMEFCDALSRSGLKVKWKAFGRVDLTDEETMRAMAAAGCCEIRYGIESGSRRVLERTRKGFTPEQATAVVSKAVDIFDRTDCFYIWGFPFETMEDFRQSVFQMVAFRALGARILPSLLCFLPQTRLYEEVRGSGRLEFCHDLLPEYMLTGHEALAGARCEFPPAHRHIFEYIERNPDLFPGFFHFDLAGNVLPKLAVLQEFGFYGRDRAGAPETESCGAHSPKVRMAGPELATRAG
ncbi:MAG: B12-binding domain-containing radical SAM protein [Elusimicrobia bacterium]|nr:B12-binding domain-containing radical SAM protein [Elusimicrobiota bacterium]